MFLGASDTVGKSVLTATGVVGTSGKAQVLYGYCFKSGLGAGTVTLFDGTSGTDPVIWDQTGVTNQTVFDNLSSGIVFTNGIYASFDSKVLRATFFVSEFLT